MKKQFFFVECGYAIEKKGDTVPLFNQVHGNQVIEVPCGSQLSSKDGSTLTNADGAFSRDPKSELHVYTADCLPLLFFTEDPEGPISAVHAGWRGVKLGIAGEALSRFPKSSSVHVAVGPSIGPCCFAVRDDFIQDWKVSGLNPLPFLTTHESRTYFHLLNYLKAHDLKPIPDDHVHLDLYRCTVCSLPQLPSFRRSKSANPRLRSWVRKLT